MSTFMAEKGEVSRKNSPQQNAMLYELKIEFESADLYITCSFPFLKKPEADR